MKKLLCATLAAALFAGCAHVPFDKSKPVQFTQGFWEAGYTQGGEFVDPDEAEAEIKTVPAAAEKIQSAHRWQWGAIGMIAGGALISLTTPNTYEHSAFDYAQYWIGLGIILGSIPLSVTAGKRLQESADEYNNAKFTTTPKTTFYLSPLKDGGTAGVQLTF